MRFSIGNRHLSILLAPKFEFGYKDLSGQDMYDKLKLLKLGFVFVEYYKWLPENACSNYSEVEKTIELCEFLDET